MDYIQIGEMIELSEENNEKLGDILILKVEAPDNATPFKDVLLDFNGEQTALASVSVRLKRDTARKLAVELLNFLEIQNENEVTDKKKAKSEIEDVK